MMYCIRFDLIDINWTQHIHIMSSLSSVYQEAMAPESRSRFHNIRGAAPSFRHQFKFMSFSTHYPRLELLPADPASSCSLEPRRLQECAEEDQLADVTTLLLTFILHLFLFHTIFLFECTYTVRIPLL